MNSSTKPPTTKKFQFDTDFEVEDERLRVDSLRQHENELKALEDQQVYVPEPVYSQADLDNAREEALHQGLQQGAGEAKGSIESTLTSLVDSAIASIDLMLAAEHTRNVTAKEIALNTTMATIKKIWPQVLQRLGQDFVETTIRQSMESNPEESRIVIRVHDTMLDPIVKRLPQLQEQQAFAGKVIVLSDTGVMAGDCKVEWADGGMERISRNLSLQLDSALERIMSSLSNTTQNIDPERTSS